MKLSTHLPLPYISYKLTKSGKQRSAMDLKAVTLQSSLMDSQAVRQTHRQSDTDRQSDRHLCLNSGSQHWKTGRKKPGAY